MNFCVRVKQLHFKKQGPDPQHCSFKTSFCINAVPKNLFLWISYFRTMFSQNLYCDIYGTSFNYCLDDNNTEKSQKTIYRQIKTEYKYLASFLSIILYTNYEHSDFNKKKFH